MKTFLFLSVLFASVGAHAHGRLQSDEPKVQFGSIFVPVTQTCVAGDEIHSVHRIPVCIEWKGIEGACSEFEKKILSTPRHFMKKVPMGEGGWMKVPMTIPLDYEIPFGHWTEGGLQVEKIVDFTIPGCEE